MFTIVRYLSFKKTCACFLCCQTLSFGKLFFLLWDTVIYLSFCSNYKSDMYSVGTNLQCVKTFCQENSCKGLCILVYFSLFSLCFYAVSFLLSVRYGWCKYYPLLLHQSPPLSYITKGRNITIEPGTVPCPTAVFTHLPISLQNTAFFSG